MATDNLPAAEHPALFPRFDPTDNEACTAVLEDSTTNAKQLQEAVLEQILSQNAQTEYLKRFLDGRSDEQSFKQNVPVIGYEGLRPYIERIANDGEPSDILCAQPISELISSSGTSGGLPKLIPITDEDLNRRKLFGRLMASVLSKCLEGLDQGKAITFTYMSKESETASGLMVRTLISSMMKSFNSKMGSLIWEHVQTIPIEITMCPDTKQSMYCQLLYGLVRRDQVVKIGAAFASTFLKTIKFLEGHWYEICSNIRTGHVSEWITDTHCSTEVSKILSEPNPKLADIIEQECSKKSWEAIVSKLWPKAKYIEAVITGSMAQYIPALEFYSGGLHLVSSPYGSSECFLGINLDPLCKPSDVSYTIIPNLGYFEFLEVKRNHTEVGDDQTSEGIENQVVNLVDVKVGHCYEPIVTTFTGLYRYRVGDILKATGFYNNAPQFQIMGRQKVVLSIDMDKTYEEDILQAVTQAKLTLEPCGLMLTDFTCRSDISSFPGHYVLYWELKSKHNNEEIPEPNPSVLEECCFKVEESLDAVYRKCRTNDKSIGPLEIKVVRPGTFDELMNFFVSRGSSMNQYKTPRSVTNEEALKILDSGVVSQFISQKTPPWDTKELHSTQ